MPPSLQLYYHHHILDEATAGGSEMREDAVVDGRLRLDSSESCAGLVMQGLELGANREQKFCFLCSVAGHSVVCILAAVLSCCAVAALDSAEGGI